MKKKSDHLLDIELETLENSAIEHLEGVENRERKPRIFLKFIAFFVLLGASLSITFIIWIYVQSVSKESGFLLSPLSYLPIVVGFLFFLIPLYFLYSYFSYTRQAVGALEDAEFIEKKIKDILSKYSELPKDM